MLRLLLKTKLRGYLNQFKFYKLSRKLGILAVAALYLSLAGLLAYFSATLFDVIHQYLPLEFRLSYALLGALFLGMVAILLISGNSFTIYTIFQSHDLPLLLSLPISRRQIFLSKFFEGTFLNTLVACIFLLPVVIGYGISMQASFYYYFFSLVLFIFLILIPTGLSIFTSLVLIRILPFSRIKEILAAAGSLLGISIWALSQLFSSRADGWLSSQNAPQNLANLKQYIDRPFYDWLPSHWAAKGLAGFAGETGFSPWWPALLLVTFASVFFFFSLIMAESVYYRGLSALQAERTRKTKPVVRPPLSEATLPVKTVPASTATPARRRQVTVLKLPGPVRALVRKDLKTLFRDYSLLINTAIFPIMMIVMPLVMQPRKSSTLTFPGSDEIFNFGFFTSFAFIFFLLIFFASQLGMRSIPAEGRGFWLVLISPQPIRQTLLGKLLLAETIAFFCGLISILILTFILKLSFLTVSVLLIIGLFSSIGATALGLWQGAAFAKFDWTNPRRMVSTSGGYTLVFINLFYLGGWAIITALTILAYRLLHLPAWAVLIILTLIGASVAWIVAQLSLSRAAGALEKREWVD